MTPTASRLIHATETEMITNSGHVEMSAIAKRAGVSIGLAYHHFGSKTGLIAAVVDKFYGPIREIALGDRIPVDLAWMEREKLRTKALVDYFYDHPLAPLIAGRLAREPEVLDIERAHMEAVLEAGALNIAQGQRRGLVDASLDPAVTVAVLMGGQRMVIDRAILAETRTPRDTLLEQMWALSCNALRLPTRVETRETQH